MLNEESVRWFSKREFAMALTSTEAEYVALTLIANDAKLVAIAGH